MICHSWIIEVHFVFCQLNFIVLFPFVNKYYHNLYIIITVLRLDSDKLVSCFFYCFSKGISRDVTPRVGEGGRFLIFDYSSPFCFLKFIMLFLSHT